MFLSSNGNGCTVFFCIILSNKMPDIFLIEELRISLCDDDFSLDFDNASQKYFGLNHLSEIPDLIGTVEVPEVPFSSISVLKRYGKKDMVYKVFSRKIMHDNLLDEIFW